MSIAEIYKAKRDRIPYPTKDDRKANPKAINAYRLKVDAVDKEFAEALEKETFGDDLAKIDKKKFIAE
jgi:acyl-[acyl carrier protein]--UDP-N-acetylglucosamine O-acyltransferase